MKQIQHRGRVITVGQNKITAKIIGQPACLGCAAQTVCGLKEGKIKTVEAVVPNAGDFKPDEEVLIGISPAAGLTAAFWAYFLPLLLMLAVLICCLLSDVSELISGISAIIILIPYYFGLFLMRKRFKQKFAFTVSKI